MTSFDSPVDNNPLTEESLQRIEDWAAELRRLITAEALKVSKLTQESAHNVSSMTGDMLPIAGSLAKAFDALNQAATFVNVATNHVEYAATHYRAYTQTTEQPNPVT